MVTVVLVVMILVVVLVELLLEDLQTKQVEMVVLDIQPRMVDLVIMVDLGLLVEEAVDVETKTVDLVGEPAEDQRNTAESEAAQIEENTDAGATQENPAQERLTKGSEQFAGVPQEILDAAFAEDDESEDKENDK